MTSSEPRTVFLADYTPPGFQIETVQLHFELIPDATVVTARLQLRRTPNTAHGSLRLDGEQLELLEIAVDGRPLAAEHYRVDAEGLTLLDPPDAFLLETRVRINPAANTALEGLYVSSGNFCTQCEAEGFRKITYYLDRPDVMARFTTTLVADREQFPVLLSNGNPTARGALEDGRHFVTWQDPFPKPSYLFALVAGDLAEIAGSFTTASGREVALRFYVEHRNRDKVDHALASLQRAMRWDEERFGLEYDLDIYMVVAVDDFNMGAMENKGLNVFNSKYVLARPESATDLDYQGIEGVIGHEYFHNWTGNRVTCRDWFQLSLKEGLTVFRDQEFSADMGSAAVKRIDEVRILRNSQFPEDAGPMAHPVRPASYQEINNFYTTTVYNKGAEVIRMYQTLLGRDGFRKGMDLYFDRHDGQAVTTDDFLAAMADANSVDLSRFSRWYNQAGTPELQVSDHFDAESGRYTLSVRQSCPATPGEPGKQPFHLPLVVGLLDAEGRDLPLHLEGESQPGGPNRVLELSEAEQSFSFTGLGARPLPSLLRNFSAPVRLRYPYSDDQLAFLMARDSDPFNRWEAGQQLYTRVLLQLVAALQRDERPELPGHLTEAFRTTLLDGSGDPALLAQALTLPSETYLAEQMETADPGAIHRARQFVRKALAEALASELSTVFARNRGTVPYRLDGAEIARRSLKNLCLAYLAAGETPTALALAFDQFRDADNMTDVLAALTALVSSPSTDREAALAAFYSRWQNDPLVVDKWLTLQAMASRSDTLEQVTGLLKHPAFTLKNPNKVRALIGAFAHGNPACFHAADGSGYRFVADRVLQLDPLNPQVAARLVSAFNRWRKYDTPRQALMIEQLQRIQRQPSLSRDVAEIVGKALG